MLSLLLDEQSSPQVAAALLALDAAVPVVSLYAWRGAALAGRDDALVLAAAAEDGLTLVTYDLKTIPPILSEWGLTGQAHGGVILVDGRSIAPNDFGSLARALLACWEAQSAWEWANRIVYLRPRTP